MNIKRESRLKLMYWYNIFITGGFSLVIAVLYFFPGLRNLLEWRGADPIVVSLIVPLFAVLAVFCALSLSNPDSGIILLKVQIFYKPFSILFFIYLTAIQKIHIVWALVIILGLLIYIAGNIWAVYGNNKD